MTVSGIRPMQASVPASDSLDRLNQSNSLAKLPSSDSEVRQLFQQSIGETFFRQMMKSLRSSTGRESYFFGSQAEKMFQAQSDELVIQKMAETSGNTFSDRLFDLQFRTIPVDQSQRLDTRV